MKSLLFAISCCLTSVCVFAQSPGNRYEKIAITPDTVVSFSQRASYITAPTQLDFSIAKPAITPFFCRQEIKWEQALKFPLRFRLGSVDQANWLEQKGDRYQPFK